MMLYLQSILIVCVRSSTPDFGRFTARAALLLVDIAALA
jgi:hypothetical protein